MGFDLAVFLSAISVIFVGDPVSTEWSIGGPPPQGILSQLGLLGRPTGLSGSHNKYESDSSPGRGDAYLHDGDASTLNMDNFLSLYNLVDPGMWSLVELPVAKLFTQRPETTILTCLVLIAARLLTTPFKTTRSSSTDLSVVRHFSGLSSPSLLTFFEGFWSPRQRTPLSQISCPTTPNMVPS